MRGGSGRDVHKRDDDDVGDDRGSSDDDLEDALTFASTLTRLSGVNSGTGSAEYGLSIDEDIEVEFELEIEGAAAGTYNVLVDGINVGQIVVNNLGRGRIELKSDPDEDELPLPSNFPNVAEGSTILVQGLMQGKFGAPVVGIGGGEGNEEETEAAFAAALSGVSAAHGSATFEISIDNDVEKEFEIEVEDAANGTYNVLVNGQNVGSITVSGGEGKLEFSTDPKIDELLLPANFPDVTDGMTVAIEGLVSGTFAAVAVVN